MRRLAIILLASVVVIAGLAGAWVLRSGGDAPESEQPATTIISYSYDISPCPQPPYKTCTREVAVDQAVQVLREQAPTTVTLP